MVIKHFNAVSASGIEHKTDTPLIVYPDAVLPTALFSFQHLKPVSGWNTKKIERGCRVQLLQFTHGNRFNIAESGDTAPLKKSLGVSAFEGFYHWETITPIVNNVKRYVNPKIGRPGSGAPVTALQNTNHGTDYDNTQRHIFSTANKNALLP
jgi:hypothetical protein